MEEAADFGSKGENPRGEDNEFARGIIDAAPMGLALVTIGGQFVYANPAFLRVFGFDLNKLLSLKLTDIAPVRDTSQGGLELQKLAAGKLDRFEVDGRTRNADGKIIWVKFAFSLQRDPESRHVRDLIVQAIDITAAKEREADLVYKESRWNHALEAARQGVWEHDIRRDEMYYSRQWRRMRGFADDAEIDGAQDVWLARLHPDDRARVQAGVPKQDSGEEGFDTFEYRERHQDGHYVWILSRGRPIEWDADGNPVRTVGTDTDITHLKEVEARLAEEKERLRTTLQSIADGVISTDANGRITFMNAAAEQMTDWTSEEAIGRRIERVFRSSTEEGEVAANPVAICMKDGKPCQLEGDHVLTSRSGRTRNIRESAAPVRMQDGEIIGAVMVFQDTTSSRKLQKELAYSASHDSLTGLPNRMAFDARLARAVDHAEAEGHVHALGILDLDRFKSVNDNSGHVAGDELLKDVVDRIRDNIRGQDCAARIGGDEFGLVLNDCDLENACMVGEKIVAAIMAMDFEWDGQKHRIGASIGFTAIKAGAGDADALYRKADEALYNAKAAGRGRVCVTK